MTKDAREHNVGAAETGTPSPVTSGQKDTLSGGSAFLSLSFVRHPDGFDIADFDNEFSADKSIPKNQVICTAEALSDAMDKGLILPKHTGKEQFFSNIALRLQKKILSFIGLARKANCAVSGFEKIREKSARKTLYILFIATDATATDKSKIKLSAQTIVCDDVFTQDELGKVFGRDSAVYTAIFDPLIAEEMRPALNSLKELVKGFRKTEKHDM